MSKAPRHLHLVNCFYEDVLEFDGPRGQQFNRFLTGSQRSRERGENEEGRYWVDKKSKSKWCHTAPTCTVGLRVA